MSVEQAANLLAAILISVAIIFIAVTVVVAVLNYRDAKRREKSDRESD